LQFWFAMAAGDDRGHEVCLRDGSHEIRRELNGARWSVCAVSASEYQAGTFPDPLEANLARRFIRRDEPFGLIDAFPAKKKRPLFC
jgi:hypothetical protein